MNFRHYYLISLFMAVVLHTNAQSLPSIDPIMIATDASDTDETGTSFTGSAPIHAKFYANAENTEGWSAHYEWRFYTEGMANEPYLVRYEEDTEYTFNTAGANFVVLYAIFTQGNDRIEYTEDYWQDVSPLVVSVSESKLEFPNAFSPNGDGINDIYKAKEGYQSIVEFHAYIYNRWGQMLFDWTNPAEGWDGTYKGKDVKQGVYFVQVKARGADGRIFNIRRDVNLLRGYTEESGIAE